MSTPTSSSPQHIARDWRSTAATFVAGAMAGACSRTATAPLDRIKIIVQEGHLVDSGTHRKLQSPSSSRLLEVSRLIRNDGGWRAFWRGNGVNCLKAGPEFALVFSLRRQMLSAIEERREYEAFISKSEDPITSCNPWLSSIPHMVTHFAVGAAAGAGAQLVLYPLEVVKTRIAVSTSGEFSGGMGEVIGELWRQGGMKAFYKGLMPNMVGIFLFRGFEVGIYSNLQAMVADQRRLEGRSKADCRLTVKETAAAGTVASIVAQTITYPLNVVRTRMQTTGLQGRVQSHCGMCDCMMQLYVKDGVRGLFHGLAANYLKAVPASAIAFVVSNKLKTSC